jgi:hypothetical protein
MEKRFLKLAPLYIFGYLLEPNAENMTQSFFYIFQIMAIKKIQFIFALFISNFTFWQNFTNNRINKRACRQSES